VSSTASVAARVAGVVLALGYVTGIVDGPVVGAIGGVALITFGRALVSSPGGELIAPGALAVLAGGTGVVALRWGTLELADIRGIQGVLGPTIVVDPLAVAIASGVALVGSVLALGLWLTEPPEGTRTWWWWVEAATGALLLSGMFVGPELAGWAEAGIWLGATALIGALAAAAASVAATRSAVLRTMVLVGCALFVAGGAAVVGSSV
jgi:hypothetical protein